MLFGQQNNIDYYFTTLVQPLGGSNGNVLVILTDKLNRYGCVAMSWYIPQGWRRSPTRLYADMFLPMVGGEVGWRGPRGRLDTLVLSGRGGGLVDCFGDDSCTSGCCSSVGPLPRRTLP